MLYGLVNHIAMNNPIFRTDRFVLRPAYLKDAEVMLTYKSDKRVNRYQGTLPSDIKEMKKMIKESSHLINTLDTWLQYVIVEEDMIIGDFGMHFLQNDAVELGITIDRKYQGRGVAFESLHWIKDYLFNELNKRELIASIDPRNMASIKLFQKLGFETYKLSKRAFKLRGEWVDDLIMKCVNPLLVKNK